MFELLTTTT